MHLLHCVKTESTIYCLLYSSAEELIPDYDRIRVLLNHNGTLHWEPGGIFRTTCDIDITYFPFDTQVIWLSNLSMASQSSVSYFECAVH